MKKIIALLFVSISFLLPLFVFGQDAYPAVEITPDTDFSQYESCTDFSQCPEYKEILTELLKMLIIEIGKAKAEIAEAGEDTDVTKEQEYIEGDYSDFPDSTYRVKSDTTLSGEIIGSVPQIILDLWEDYKKVSPDIFTKEYISYLRVFYDEDESSAAYVETDRNDYDKWGLGINLADLGRSNEKEHKQLVDTLIHEFAHIVTLNNKEIDFKIRKRNCDTYHSGEGCLKENSYLNQFVQEFWDASDFENSEEIEDERDDEDKDDISDVYFEDHSDEFVSSYSTWHPAEDIAETFAIYVLEDKPRNDEKEVDEKILFFYDFEELINMRDMIRQNFDFLFDF